MWRSNWIWYREIKQSSLTIILLIQLGVKEKYDAKEKWKQNRKNTKKKWNTYIKRNRFFAIKKLYNSAQKYFIYEYFTYLVSKVLM